MFKSIRSHFSYFSRLYYLLLVIIIIFIIGTFGYYIIEEWTIFDSFYMTVITVTTVGFGEIHELSTLGRAFTAFLIIISLGVLAFVISSINSYLSGGEYVRKLKKLVKMKTIQKLENHIIVCGYGKVGKQICEELQLYKKEFVIIDNNENHFTKVNSETLFIVGDATDDSILIEAGINKAKEIIIALPKDTDNLFVVLSSKELNPKIGVIARAIEQSSAKKLKIAGANQVVMPDVVGGSTMASLVVRPDLYHFMNLIKLSGDSDVNLEEIDFQNLPVDYQNCTIQTLIEKTQTKCNFIGFKTNENKFIINPDLSTSIIKNSKFFVLGTSKQIEELNKFFNLG